MLGPFGPSLALDGFRLRQSSVNLRQSYAQILIFSGKYDRGAATKLSLGVLAFGLQRTNERKQTQTQQHPNAC